MKKRAYGTGRVFHPKGTKIWYIAYWHDGKKIVESSRGGGRTGLVKQEAETLLRTRLTGVDRGEVSTLTLKKVTYGVLRNMLVDYYREQNRKSLQETESGDTIWGLSKLDAFFGYDPKDPNSGWPLAQISSAAADKFRKQRLAESEFETKREAGDEYAGHAIINRSLALLRKMLNLFAERNQGYTVPHIGFLAEPPARKGFATREQFQALVDNLPDHLRPLVTYLYWTGCRLGETSQIKWEQVDLGAAQVRLEAEQTKSGEGRIIPLADEVLRALAGAKDTEPLEKVIRILEKNDKTGLVFSTNNLRMSWARACVAAGLGTLTPVEGTHYKRYEGLTVHDLRRSAIRNLMNVGISEQVAMKISGHKTNSVFKRYNIVNAEDVTEAMRRLEVKTNGHGLRAKAKQPALPPARKK